MPPAGFEQTIPESERPQTARSLGSTKLANIKLENLVVTLYTTRLNIQKFYVLPAECFCFMWLSEQT